VKVFLDTNVLASGAATRGLCSDVLREVFAYHELFISQQVLRELRHVLSSKFFVAQDLIDEFVLLLEEDGVQVQPASLPEIELQDKDDLPIVGAPIAAGTEVLITGDNELLHLTRVGNLEILSPRQFWEKLKTLAAT
jgi:uncharacterized protein